MTDQLAILNSVEPLIRSYAKRHCDVDDLRQRCAVEIAQRSHNRLLTTLAIATGIVRNVASDMISESIRHRQRFISFSDLDAARERTSRRSTARAAIEREQPDRTFSIVWERQSCQAMRAIARKFRKLLRPHELRVLRGRRRGATQAQMATREGVAPGTIGSWVSRARQKLEMLLT